MMQLPMFQPPTWSVTDLTRYLRDLLESDENLQDLWVEGEVSNLSRPASGHLYFTLKDSSAALRCVMWRNAVMRQTHLPGDGDAIEVHGSLSIYEASGHYQLYADLIRPAGEGQLYQEFLRLKAKLETEGLFDPQRKRAIPRWPQTIGIVTSPTGAALRDMLNTINRRYPPVKVVLAPTLVQGDEAPGGIISALETLNQLVKPDLILLARGGGSIEDLWAFNDEHVARAIVASQSPIITGIGHETDFTIADFAADLRAPTPTAAAELATPNQVDLRASLSELGKNIHNSMGNFLILQRRQLERQQNRLLLRTPLARVHRDQQHLDELSYRACTALSHTIEINRTRLTGLEMRLNSLNPQAILKRGYSIVTQLDGRLVHSVKQVQPDDNLQVRVSDGEFEVRVDESGKIEK
jgi:exodeoxyribonuclease VII large subunit